MIFYEYKVVPAPRRGVKVRGVRAGEDRFALTLAGVMNAQAAEGWEYQRTETLPSEEREGLLSKTTVFQNMMVFRRVKEAAQSSLPSGQSVAPAPSPAAAAAVPAADLPASVTDTADDAAQAETSEQPATAPKPPLTAQR